jgi:hypothetical protein
MRINSRKIRKILGRVRTAPKRIFETFCTQETPGCIGMNATLTSNQFIFIQKIKQWFFSYTRFLVNKINVEKNFKIMRKSLFNYSLYSHPEIGNFRVWQMWLFLRWEVLSDIPDLEKCFGECSHHSTSGLELTFRDHVWCKWLRRRSGFGSEKGRPSSRRLLH